MSVRQLPLRADVLEMLASYGDRAPEAVDEQLGSLELTWLIAEAEQRYEAVIDLTDQQLDRIRTVDDAVQVLREILGGEADGQGGPQEHSAAAGQAVDAAQPARVAQPDGAALS